MVDNFIKGEISTSRNNYENGKPIVTEIFGFKINSDGSLTPRNTYKVIYDDISETIIYKYTSTIRGWDVIITLVEYTEPLSTYRVTVYDLNEYNKKLASFTREATNSTMPEIGINIVETTIATNFPYNKPKGKTILLVSGLGRLYYMDDDLTFKSLIVKYTNPALGLVDYSIQPLTKSVAVIEGRLAYLTVDQIYYQPIPYNSITLSNTNNMDIITISEDLTEGFSIIIDKPYGNKLWHISTDDHQLLVLHAEGMDTLRPSDETQNISYANFRRRELERGFARPIKPKIFGEYIVYVTADGLKIAKKYVPADVMYQTPTPIFKELPTFSGILTDIKDIFFLRQESILGVLTEDLTLYAFAIDRSLDGRSIFFGRTTYLRNVVTCSDEDNYIVLRVDGEIKQICCTSDEDYGALGITGADQNYKIEDAYIEFESDTPPSYTSQSLEIAINTNNYIAGNFNFFPLPKEEIDFTTDDKKLNFTFKTEFGEKNYFKLYLIPRNSKQNKLNIFLYYATS